MSEHPKTLTLGREELEALREKIAIANGITLYRLYGESEAAHFLGCDVSTLKKHRRGGKVAFVNLGERRIRYMGYMICDLMAFGFGDGKIPKD